jgi:molybdate transport system ATP-binding protein
MRWPITRFDGGVLLTTAPPGPPGSKHRVRLRARDIAVAIEPPRGISTQNLLAATVQPIVPIGDRPEVFLRLAIGGTIVLARITAESVGRLGLVPGLAVTALIKSVTFDQRVPDGAPA